MVALAELGLERHGNAQFDTSWQETLNHATLKVKFKKPNNGERERKRPHDRDKNDRDRY